MSKMKRIVSLTLAVLMAASVMSACTTNNGDDNPNAGKGDSNTEDGTPVARLDYSDPAQISKDVIKPTFMLTYEEGDGTELVWDAIKTLTNIEFEVMPVPLASWVEKEATTMASGNIPDIIGCRSYRTVDKYGPQGAFLNFEPYIEKGMMPNYVEVLDSLPPATTLSTSPDGNRYSAPRIYESPRMDQAILVRVDVFEKLGLSREPESLDEFYDSLVKIKEAYPDSTPYFNRWKTDHLLGGFSNMCGTSYTYYLAPGADEYVFGPDSQNFKDALIFGNKLYENGLLDKDFATLSDEEYEEKLITGKAMVTYDYQDTAGFYEESKDLMEDGWAWGAMLSPKYNGEREKYPTLHGYYGYTKAIGAKTEYADEMIKFIDWTYSEVGQQTLMFGVEGEHHTKGADGSIEMITDILYAGNPTGSIKAHGLNDQDIFSVMPTEGSEFFENVGEFTIAQKKYLTENDAFAEAIFAARFYDDKKQKEYDNIRVATETYILEEATKVIQGDSSIDDWDKIIDVCKNTYNSDLGLTLINEAYVETFGE